MIIIVISCSPTSVSLMFSNPSLLHVFGMSYHLNSALFLYLHHYDCQSQDIIFIRLLYPSSSPGLPLKTTVCDLYRNAYPDLLLIIHPLNLSGTNLNSYSASSDSLEI